MFGAIERCASTGERDMIHMITNKSEYNTLQSNESNQYIRFHLTVWVINDIDGSTES